MLTYKNIRLLHALLSTAAIVAYFVYGNIFLYIALALFVLYLVTIAYGAFNIQAGFFLPLHNEGSSSTRQLALTFDDGPSEQTAKVLDLLKQYQLKATFFLIGSRIASHPSIVQRIINDGHEVGNHTFHHAYATGFYSEARLNEEIQSTNEALYRLTGWKTRLFRPPFGVTTPPLAKVVSQLQLHPIGWSVRSFDTTGAPTQSIVKRILTQVKPGAVLLLHDDRVKCQEVLEKLLPALLEQQYTFVTVSDLFKINAYEN